MPAIIYHLCLLTSLCRAVFCPSATYGQGKITLQHDGQFTYYPSDSLQAALDDARNGDLILLPGGTFTGPFTLDRSISLIGVGFHPDSTTATSASILSGDLVLSTGASNSYLSGIHITTDVRGTIADTRVDNIIMHRILIGDDIFGFHTASSNWLIVESAVNSISPMQSCRIHSSIIDGEFDGHSNAIVEYSILLYGTNLPDPAVDDCANCTFQGNIFTHPQGSINGASGGQWSLARNNVFVKTSVGNSVSSVQNILGVTQSSIFTAFSGGTTWVYSMDLHLAPNSPAIGAGPGGTDCGIYGGPSPWKEGSVPITPHIQEQIIGTTTSPTGGLPVQIRVSAQDR